MTRKDKRIFDALRALLWFRRSEWMVTHDWGGNRDEILDRVDEILESSWATKILKDVRLDEVGKPIIERSPAAGERSEEKP